MFGITDLMISFYSVFYGHKIKPMCSGIIFKVFF